MAGIIIGTMLGRSNRETIQLALALAFLSGLTLTTIPLMRSGYERTRALRLAFAADTVSIVIMKRVDNSVMLAIHR